MKSHITFKYLNLEFGEIAAFIPFFSGWKTQKLFFEYDDVIVTSQLAVQVWEVGISWFLESILSGIIINSQIFHWRKSQKILNRDLSIVHIEAPVGSRKLIYWYIIVRILTSFRNIFLLHPSAYKAFLWGEPPLNCA